MLPAGIFRKECFAEKCPAETKQAELRDDVSQRATGTTVRVGNRGLGKCGRAPRLMRHFHVFMLSSARYSRLGHFTARAEVAPESEYAEVERRDRPDEVHDSHLLRVANLIDCNQNRAKECDSERRPGDRVKHSCVVSISQFRPERDTASTILAAGRSILCYGRAAEKAATQCAESGFIRLRWTAAACRAAANALSAVRRESAPES